MYSDLAVPWSARIGISAMFRGCEDPAAMLARPFCVTGGLVNLYVDGLAGTVQI